MNIHARLRRVGFTIVSEKIKGEKSFIIGLIICEDGYSNGFWAFEIENQNVLRIELAADLDRAENKVEEMMRENSAK